MKKLFVALMALVVLTGCGAKPVTKVFELTEEEPGYTYSYKHTYTAEDDFIVKGVIETTMTIEEPLDGEIETFIEYLQVEEACPYGVLDDEGKQTLYCSKYIDFAWKQEGNSLTTIETIDFKGADKNKEDIYDAAAGGEYSEDEYYSMELFTSDLLAEGFTEVK
ncbi:hypothetical protein [Anaerorhabdus sp.]|uniref:hypothetical protein n=1 Tax=Anaerorhabdus sp. TaxID=1872524 RepID=UPI002FC760D5